MEARLICPSMRSAVVVGILALLVPAALCAQPPSPPASTPPPVSTAPPASTPPKTPASTGATGPANSPRAKARTPVLGDYVPCLFDEGQIYDLRAQPDPSKQPLTETEAEKAVSTIRDNLQSTAPAEGGSDPTYEASQKLKSSMLVGVPRSSLSDVTTAWLTSQPGTDRTRVAAAATAAQASAGGTPGTFDRPPDVSCSFSIMQWQETRDTFGRRVANQYIAIEVNVRNLNSQNDFLIHDVQIAVDTGLDRTQFGRFQAGRDKQIVRAVIQRGQSEDFRNLAINSLLMIGAIAGGASAAVTQGLLHSAS